MSRRTLGVVLIVLGLVGLVGTAWVIAARPDHHRPAGMWARVAGGPGGPTCTPPALPGQTVDVVLSDMGGMMGGGMMGSGATMRVAASPSTVGVGDVSFRVWNTGMMVHELVVLPLPPGGAGSRAVDGTGRVSEEGSLGEASSSCGEGAGEGIAPGAAGWVTLPLTAGGYELICNLPGHYARGMFTELDVR